ncbi:hypothetical protein EYF80_023504 [Liparis tanakae]|uniref:Uncharacterized protein n=1 Tax=Liparis tanakae TaxID=230148 RepID=A0A4Z2HL49_9TELE|nr:hypothetical protein EYF80_023504 [Liparis tanakae]
MKPLRMAVSGAARQAESGALQRISCLPTGLQGQDPRKKSRGDSPSKEIPQTEKQSERVPLAPAVNVSAPLIECTSTEITVGPESGPVTSTPRDTSSAAGPPANTAPLKTHFHCTTPLCPGGRELPHNRRDSHHTACRVELSRCKEKTLPATQRVQSLRHRGDN